MNGKYLLIVIVAAAFFALAASHRFHDSAHAMGMIKKGGGMARHPALLDNDRESYILIATAGVVPPYSGNARVVLEGDPTLKATYYNSGPVLDLGLHRHPRFYDNTYYGLQPGDKVSLWVRIARDRSAPVAKPQAPAAQQPSGKGPDCPQCEGEEPARKVTGGMRPDSRPLAPPEVSGSRRGSTPDGIKNNTASNSTPAAQWRGRNRDDAPAAGPALAFYDVETRERLLRIPIRFTGGTRGGGDGH